MSMQDSRWNTTITLNLWFFVSGMHSRVADTLLGQGKSYLGFVAFRKGKRSAWAEGDCLTGVLVLLKVGEAVDRFSAEGLYSITVSGNIF
jgi:hypothetical protein